MKHVTKQLIIVACILSLCTATGPAAVSPETDTPSLSFSIQLSKQYGEISHSFKPSSREHRIHPDFILIQNVHCSQQVQYTISNILKQLKTQGLLPGTIAVEGAVGRIKLGDMQSDPDDENRRLTANTLVSQGSLTGALHFALSEGHGDLYGVEEPTLYATSVNMFRKSFEARMDLNKKLDKLAAALALLKSDSDLSANAYELTEDVRVIRQLIDQHLTPEEVSQTMNRAVVSLDHLKSILQGGVGTSVLRAVSAAVDFYALAFLRDEALFRRSLQLRQREQQETTVIVAGGFHTAGLMKRLRDQEYSFVVITPRVTSHNRADERLYVERILGHRLPEELTDEKTEMKGALEKAQAEWLAADLHKKLTSIKFSSPPIRDIFTAMDLPWIDPSVKLSLINQRTQILETTVTSTPSPQVARVF